MILEAMTNRLRRNDMLDADVEVMDYDEVKMHDGYCETCYYEWMEVKYYLSNGETYQENITFAELIRELG